MNRVTRADVCVWSNLCGGEHSSVFFFFHEAINLLVTDGMLTLSPNKCFVWLRPSLLQVICSTLRAETVFLEGSSSSINSATGSRIPGHSRGRIFSGDKPLEAASEGNAALNYNLLSPPNAVTPLVILGIPSSQQVTSTRY